MLNAAWIVAVAMTLKTATAPPAPAQAATEWTDDRPITRLAQNLGHDIQNLPTLQTAAVVGAGLIGVAVSRGSDAGLADRVRASSRSSYSRLGGGFGHQWFQSGGAIGAYAIGKLTHQPEVTHIGSDLIRAQMLNGVLTTGLKVAVARDRPGGGARSFPSGHSSATVASAVVLSDHFGWKVGLPAYAISTYVGWSRVRANQHWLSDVVFGGAIGVVAGKTITGTHHHSGWMIAPSVTRGGGAIYVIKR